MHSSYNNTDNRHRNHRSDQQLSVLPSPSPALASATTSASTTTSTTNNTNNDPKVFGLKPYSVYQLFLAITVWSIGATLLSLLIWLIVLPQFTLSPVINTSSGRILGTIETRLNNKRIAIFRGIPYAKPPIGERRFTRPEPTAPWKGIYSATVQPPCCYQFTLDSPSSPESSDMVQSEDCLYLNLYVPMNDGDGREEEDDRDEDEMNELKSGINGAKSRKNKGKPVLIFIHGGGFMGGSINHYDPSILAIEGNIIVATIGYRLGLFGFIYYELSDKPGTNQGNLGLYDQSLALKWIHSNIHHFKGDPANIVLFGDFAGAQSVGFHLISNRSQSYLSRAILLNGSPFNIALIMSRERGLNRTRALINATGCWRNAKDDDNYDTDPDTDHNDTSDRPEVNQINITTKAIDCLKSLEASQIINIDRSLSQQSAVYLTYYPVAEESFFHIHPFEIIESGEYGTQTEIMVGNNGHYGSWMQDLGLTDFIITHSNGTKLGSSDVTSKMLVSSLAKFGPNIGRHYYEILTQIIMEDHSVVSPIILAERVNSLTLDLAFRCPNYFLVTSLIQNETRSVYYFELRASSNYELMNKMLISLASYNYTSSKTNDLGLIFGYPLEVAINGKYINYFDQDDVSLSKEMMNLWIQFIKNGKPAQRNTWIPCTNESELYRYIIKKKGSKLETGFPENQCDKYFRILYIIGKSIGKS